MQVVLIALLLLAAVTGATAAAEIGPTQDRAGTIDNVTVEGPAIAVRNANATYVWKNRSVVVYVTVHHGQSEHQGRACLSVVDDHPNASRQNVTVTAGCEEMMVGNFTRRFSLGVANLTGASTGPNLFRINYTARNRTDTATLPFYLVRMDGDIDEDGLNNSKEVEIGTYLNTSDSDNDGLSDSEEVRTYETSPVESDTDGDGLLDGHEISIGTDPTDPDHDGDGLQDGEEVHTYGSDPAVEDSDGDGYDDAAEVQAGTDPTSPMSHPGDGTPTDEPVGPTGPMQLAGLLTVVTLVAGMSVAAGYWFTDSADQDVDPESLPNDEYARHVIDQHGGRMQQTDLVEETEWSKAKVSRILSDMEEEGTIRRERVGRGNVVKLTDDEE